ncbi:hypothetical protein WLZ34_05945 [Thermogladius sp. KZ2Tp1]|uniref:hypothetical protein n=1 Tax=Thermogladius sp. KZ2Tp1 TaxID=3136289 RepID=UPI003DA8B937
MKEIVEYVLAFIILLSVIPVFNMMVNVYYKPLVKAPQTNVVDIYATAVSLALSNAFSSGNLTPELPELYNSIVNYVNSAVGETIYSRYGFNATVSSGVTAVTVSGGSLVVKTLYNGTLAVLLVFKGGGWSTLSKASPDAFDPSSGTYTYTFTLQSTPQAVVAVLESSSARFVNYWFQDPSASAYLYSSSGNVMLAVSNSVLSTVMAYNHPNFSTVYNTTLLYYANNTFNAYSSTYYEPLVWVVFYPGRYDNVTLNRSSIGYYSRPAGAWNSTYSTLRTFVGETHVTVNLTCQWVSGNYYCSNPVYVSSWAGTRDLVLPISNLVMVVVYDGSNSIPAPVYRGAFSVGERPPSSGYWETTYYVRLGLFDYVVDLKVWQR